LKSMVPPTQRPADQGDNVSHHSTSERRERPRHRSAAECSQQIPPSDGDCHTPLPCEVRKWERYHATSAQSSRSRRASGQSLLSDMARGPNTTDQTKPGCAQRRHGPTRILKSKLLLSPPAPGGRRHRGLACRLVTVRRRVVLGVAEGERPQPRRPTGAAAAFMMRPIRLCF